MLLEPELDPETYELWWQIIFGPEGHTRHNDTPTAFEVSEPASVVAIYDSPAKGIIMPMDNAKYDELFDSINSKLFADILNDKRSDVPTFVFNQLARGAMKIGCFNNGGKCWLSNAIEHIAPLWHNMQLKIVDSDELPAQNRDLGKFPHCILSAEQIHSILIAMNPKLDIKC